MDKIAELVKDLKKVAFDDREIVKKTLSKAKLTIPELKTLYKTYTNSDKSCLYGVRDNMINMMVEHICSPSAWMSIVYGRGLKETTRWELLSPQQKYHFCEAREQMFKDFKGQKASIEQQCERVYEIMKSNNMYDENVDVFVKHALK